MAEYEVLEEDLRGYRDGDEVEVVVQEHETRQTIPVRAVIYRDPDKAQGEKLWVRALETGILRPTPWCIQILEEVDYEDFARKKFHSDRARYGTMRP